MPASSLTRSVPLSRADLGLSLVFGLAGAAAYIRTLYPSVLPGDGAEFQTLGFLLGTAHTTGYSIYLLLARLATWLPFGNPAYRVNLLSALMGGLTLALVYLLGGWLHAAVGVGQWRPSAWRWGLSSGHRR